MKLTSSCIFGLALSLLLFLSCPSPSSIGGSPDGNEKPGDNITVPVEFTRKVILEIVTATWGIGCPAADAVLGDLIDDYPGRVYAACFHVVESGYPELEVPGITDMLVDGYGWDYTVPRGTVNRRPDAYPDSYGETLMTKEHWRYNIEDILATQTTTCGLRIGSEVDGDDVSVGVYVGFSAGFDEGNLFLTLLLAEDGVTGYDQQGAGSPYTLNGVVRAVLTPLEPTYGQPLVYQPAQGAEAYAYLSYDFSLSSYPIQNPENLRFLAFVHRDIYGSRSLLNGQQTAIDTIKDFD
jgi:hypothetical protein